MIDNCSLDSTISSDIDFNIQRQPSIQTKSFQIRVHTSVCPHEGYGVYQSRWNLFEATLSSGQPIWNRFLNRQDPCATPVGSVIFVPRDEPVGCHFTQGARHTLSCLFDLDALGFQPSASWDWSGLEPSVAFDVRDPYVQMAVQRLRQEVSTPGFASEVQIECTLIFLAAQLRRYVDTRQIGHDGRALSTIELRSVLERIHDEDGPAPSVAELAAILGMSAPVFSNKFRQTMGRTLRKYVANAKLEKAKALLMEDKEMIKQIAFRCGFGSAAAFTTSFRQEIGMTPTEFRRQNVDRTSADSE